MSEAMAPVPDSHPLMVAWKAHQQTEAYANSKRWASAVHKDEHLQGPVGRYSSPAGMPATNSTTVETGTRVMAL